MHEAVRAGHLDVVKYLVENGVDINALTSGDQSPLTIANGSLGPKHKVTKYLIKLGAEAHGYFDSPEDDEEEAEYEEEAAKEDIVPSITAVEKEILDAVPTILGEDDDEEL